MLIKLLMMSIRPLLTTFVFGFSMIICKAQVTIADAFPGCLQVTDKVGVTCGGGSALFDVNGSGQFEVNNIDGQMCCGGSSGGSTDSYFEFEVIDISSFMNVTFMVDYSASATAYEDDSPGAPILGCVGTNIPDNSHDQIIFAYSLNGGSFMPFAPGAYIHGTAQSDFTGTYTSPNINGNTLKIRIYASNKASAEAFYFENLIVKGTPKTIDAGPDKITCGTASVTLMGSGTGTWSGGAGVFGNVNNATTTYTPAASELGSTVTLTFAGKAGTAGCAGTYPAPSDDVEITVSSAPQADFSGGAMLCQGECADVTINIVGGTPPFTVSFSAQFGSLPPINIPNVIISTFTDIISVCYTTSTFPLPQWNVGTNTISIPANAAGTSGNFTLLTIRDDNNCPGTINGSVDFDFLPQPQANPYILAECGDASGVATFDLNEAQPFILGSEVGFVTYYTDIALTNMADNPYTGTSTILYAIITNADGCNSIPVELTLDVKPPGDVGAVSLACNPCNICDDDGIAGEDITILLNLPTNGSYNVDLAYNISGNITNINESVLGPVGNIDVNITGDASFVVLSVTEGNECPDVTGLGAPITIIYNVKPKLQGIGPLTSCAPINLPTISVSNSISGGQTGYFTGPNGTGTKFNPGDLISSSINLYVYSGKPDCFDQQSISVTIGGLTTYAEPKDTTVCGQYILPSIQGTGVSAQAAYFTQQMGVGTLFKAGDTIKNTTTLYVFEPSNPACQTNNPDIIVTITPGPQIKLDSTVFSCEKYTLPKITGINLPGNQAYFSNPQFTGMPDTVGTVVAKTDTFYLFTGTLTCYDKDTLYIKIDKNTKYDSIPDINACNAYQLPPILGNNVDTSAYFYSGPNGSGTIYKVGDLITAPITLYVFDTLNNCQVNLPSFDLTVAPGPDIFTIEDTTVCESFTLLPIQGNNLTNANYFTGPNGTGQSLSPGSSIVTSSIIYAYETNAACATQKSFNVEIEQKPNAGLGKILGMCQESSAATLNLFDLISGSYDANGTWTLNGTGLNINDPTQVIIPSNIMPGSYKFSYTITPKVCFPAVTFSELIIVPEPLAGADSIMNICQGLSTPLNLFSILKNPSSNNGKFLSSISIPDPTKLDVSTLPVGGYTILYSLENTNAASSTNCRDTASITLNITSGLNAGSNNEKAACKGATIELKDLLTGQSSIGIFKEKINIGKLNGSLFNTTGLAAGKYTIYHIIPANGSCKSDTAEIIIDVKDLISAGNDIAKQYCSIKPIDLDSLISAQNLGGQFSFSGFGGNLNLATNIFTPTIGATFEIKYAVGDGVICPTDEASVTLTFIEKPNIILIASPTICLGETLPLTVDCNGGFDMNLILQNDTQFQSGNLNNNLKNISIDNINGSQSFNIEASIFKPNTKYHLFIKDATTGICTFNFNIDKVFDVLASPTREIKDKYCEGEQVKIGNTTFNVSFPADTLLINNASGCDSVLYVNLKFNKASTSEYNFVTCNGDFTYTLNGKTFNKISPEGLVLLGIKNAAGCDSTVNVKLTFNQPDMTLDVDPAACAEGSGIITINDVDFIKGSPTLFINGVKTDSLITYPKQLYLNPGNYTIALLDKDDCRTQENITIDIDDEPIVTIVEKILPNGTKQLSYTSTKPLSGISWSPLGLVSCQECQVTDVLGIGEVTLDYEYGIQCQSKAVFLVKKEIIKNIYFPTIINPLSNQGNNKFYPQKPLDYDVKAISMRIFDRWGNLVWQNLNFDIGFQENGWDGTLNGNAVTPGVYVYTLETLDVDNISKTYVGDVTVIR